MHAVARPASFTAQSAQIIEIALYQDERRSLVAGTAGQITQTNRSGPSQAARRRSLGSHVADKVRIFFDGSPPRIASFQRLTAELGEIIVRQILQLQFVRRTFQALWCKPVIRPDRPAPRFFPTGSLERAVAIHHDFHMFAGCRPAERCWMSSTRVEALLREQL